MLNKNYSSLPGNSLYGYQLFRPIGTGGMADIFYAENSLGKPAAVKVLKLKYSDEQIVHDRFISEAKTTVKLHHPNIREVYDLGDIDGRPAILMEYVEGQSLLEVLMNKGKVDNDNVLEWFNQVVSGLQYAHKRGVIHRDIKPSNLFLTNDGQIKILDFGITKVKENITMTQTGQTLGTLTYMSPEQVMDPKRVDERTDIYSLGVTFYHLLTGKMPYDIATDSGYVIQKKIVEEKLNLESLPSEWKETLESCLRKEVGKRNWGKLQSSTNHAAVTDEKTLVAPASTNERIPENKQRFSWRWLPMPRAWHFALLMITLLMGLGIWNGMPALNVDKEKKLTSSEKLALRKNYKKENVNTRVKNENPLLDEIYNRLGGKPEDFDEFAKNFYASKILRETVYERLGASKDKFEELDRTVMGNAPTKPATNENKQIESEESSVIPPESIAVKPIENKPVTLEFFGGSSNGKIDLPVSDNEGGVEIQKVRSDGEFGIPQIKDDGYYVDYKVKGFTENNNNISLNLVGVQSLIPKKKFDKTYEIYLGPTNEFSKAYNDLSYEEKQVYFKYDDDFKNNAIRGSLVEFNHKVGVTKEVEVEYLILGIKDDLEGELEEETH